VEGLVIRVASDADLDSVVTHYGRESGETPWDPFCDLERLRQIPRQGLLVAETSGTYAGFVYWHEARRPWYAPGDDRYARISELHVVPGCQGRGIGRALFQEALRRARAAGIDTVFLETDEGNSRARALYKSEGFTEFARVLRYRRGEAGSPVDASTRARANRGEGSVPPGR
jgi:ribosomal protein S18 acetylase RimI-like enzyme